MVCRLLSISLFALVAFAQNPGTFRTRYFEENLGQAASSVRFLTRLGGHRLQIDPQGTTSILDGKDSIRMTFANSAGAQNVTGADPHQGVSHYVSNGAGNDITGARHFGRVLLREVYPKIDLAYYFAATGTLEYDFLVKPGADPTQIALRFSGATPKLAADGSLLLKTASGELRQGKPRVYQDQTEIPSKFQIRKDGTVSFTVAKYDASQELVIDPPINYLTYLGDSNDNRFPSIKTDGSGNAYVNYQLPLSNGPVVKYGPTGQIVFSTTVNNPANAPVASSAYAVDSSGRYFMAYRDNFDNQPPSRMVKLDPSGTVLYDVRIPGAQNLIPRSAAADNDGNNYVCGDFVPNVTPRVPTDATSLHPTLLNAASPPNNGFLLKIGSNGQVLYGTYLPNYCTAVTVDPAANVYVLLPSVAVATSPYPLTAVFGSSSLRPGVDPFGSLIAKINPAGTAVINAVIFRYHDIAYLAAGNDGSLYVGSQYIFSPIYAALVNPLRSSAPATEFAEGYFAKINPNFQTLAWGTLVGGSGKEWFSGMAIDPAGNLAFAGFTTSNDFPVVDAIQSVNTNATEQCPGTIVGQINSAGTAFSFLSYVGGTACLRTIYTDLRGTVAADNGAIYLAGTVKGAMPVVNAAQPSYAGGTEYGDIFVLKIGSTTIPGCTYTLGANSANIANTGGTGSVTVTTASNCAFTATTSASFINVTGGGLGSGSRTVTFSVNNNPGPARTDAILIAGQLFTINQAAAVPVMTSVTPNPALPGSRTYTIFGTTIDPNTVQVDIAGIGTIANASLLTKSTTQLTFNANLPVGNHNVTIRNGAGGTASNIIVMSVLSSIPDGSHFVPLAPCRAADTRNMPLGAITGATIRDFLFTACNLPGNATAVALNVTLVPSGQFGFISIWPAGQPRPTVSTMNSLDGRIKANMAVVGLGVDKGVSIYVTDTAHVILDVNGYFVPAGTPGALAFYSVSPCRVVDTRLTGGIIPALGTRKISGGCLPTNAQAYSLNVTTVPAGPLGFLTLWPDGSPQPLASTLNNLTGTVVANAAILTAGTGGAFNAYVTDASHLIVDLNGYFAAPGQPGALALYPMTPCRIFDTRMPNGPFGGPILALNATRNFTIPSSACNVPSTAQSYVTNATVVPPGVFGYLTLYPNGVPQPTVSTLNAIDGALHSNAAIVPAGTGGVVSVYTSDVTHLLLDISGYFAP